MKKVVSFAMALAVLLALSGGTVFADHESATIALMEQNNSGQSGTATLTVSDDLKSVTVEINISGGSEVPQPAHIHAGTCANLDPKPAVPLNNVVNGKSVTVITEESGAGMGDMEANEFAINVHKSAAEASVYVACGDIATANVVGMPRTGDGGNILTLLGVIALMAVGTGTVLSFARRKA